jgi:hypothetical protein
MLVACGRAKGTTAPREHGAPDSPGEQRLSRAHAGIGRGALPQPHPPGGSERPSSPAGAPSGAQGKGPQHETRAEGAPDGGGQPPGRRQSRPCGAPFLRWVPFPSARKRAPAGNDSGATPAASSGQRARVLAAGGGGPLPCHPRPERRQARRGRGPSTRLAPKALLMAAASRLVGGNRAPAAHHSCAGFPSPPRASALRPGMTGPPCHPRPERRQARRGRGPSEKLAPKALLMAAASRLGGGNRAPAAHFLFSGLPLMPSSRCIARRAAPAKPLRAASSYFDPGSRAACRATRGDRSPGAPPRNPPCAVPLTARPVSAADLRPT